MSGFRARGAKGQFTRWHDFLNLVRRRSYERRHVSTARKPQSHHCVFRTTLTRGSPLPAHLPIGRLCQRSGRRMGGLRASSRPIGADRMALAAEPALCPSSACGLAMRLVASRPSDGETGRHKLGALLRPHHGRCCPSTRPHRRRPECSRRSGRPVPHPSALRVGSCCDDLQPWTLTTFAGEECGARFLLSTPELLLEGRFL